ncbi:MAG: endonuclease/exonuclease/phosphatase family protein [Stellaceae bacterium]
MSVIPGRSMQDYRSPVRRLATMGSHRPALTIATYNIHGCVGVDRRYEPGRIAAVLREIDADVTCLQEVGIRRASGPHDDQASYLAAATGRRVILAGGARGRRGRFANAILTRFPVIAARAIDLAVWVYEPRAALDVELMIGERRLRVVATHFGLHAGERRWQADRLIAALREPCTPGRDAADAVLLVGDLNEWRGRSGGIRALDRCLGPSAAPRTFPSWMPMLPLDRIYADGPAVLRDVQVYRSPVARLASDHLPLIGSLWWAEGAAVRGVPRPLFPYSNQADSNQADGNRAGGNRAGAGLGAIAAG